MRESDVKGLQYLLGASECSVFSAYRGTSLIKNRKNEDSVLQHAKHLKWCLGVIFGDNDEFWDQDSGLPHSQGATSPPRTTIGP